MRIVAFGDTILSDIFFKSKSYSQIVELLHRYDCVTFNMETVVSDSARLKNKDKAVCFKTSLYNAKKFKNDVNEEIICNIANNHIYDYYTEGFGDTYKNLLDTGYGIVGEKHYVAHYEDKGVKIALLGCWEKW